MTSRGYIGLAFLVIFGFAVTESREILLALMNKNITINVEEKLRIRCTPSDGTAKLTWYRDDTELVPPLLRVRITGQWIVIRKVNFGDTGKYGCKIVARRTVEWRNVSVTVVNPADSLQRDEPYIPLDFNLPAQRPEEEPIDLVIEARRRLLVSRSLHMDADPDGDKADETQELSAPYFLKPEQNILKVVAKPAGNMLRLKCPSGGNPTPNITWTKNNEEPNRLLGVARKKGWALFIGDLVPHDSGNYTCVVCNTQGCINHTFKVDVVERFPHKPYIYPGFPKNVTAELNSTVQFDCTLVSDLEPYIQWFRVAEYPDEDTETPNGTLIQAHDRENPDVLQLYNVTQEDEGWYTCIARNTLGTSFSSAYLRVVETTPSTTHREISVKDINGIKTDIAAIKSDIAEIKNVLKEFLKNVPGVKNPSFQETYELDLPLATFIDLQSFNEKLTNNEDFRADFVQSLLFLIDSSSSITMNIRGILKKFISRSLAMELTASKAAAGKTILKGTPICDALLDSFKTKSSNNPGYEVSEKLFFEKLDQVLGNSRDWDGRRGHGRRNKQPVEAEINRLYQMI